MLADCGLVGRILLRRRAPVPLMEALTTRTQSADSVTIVTPMEIDGHSRPVEPAASPARLLSVQCRSKGTDHKNERHGRTCSGHPRLDFK
jgi:hypothetical protein